MNEDKKRLNRRNFIKLSAMAAVVSGSSFKANSCPVLNPVKVDDKGHYVSKRTRLTMV